MTDTAGGGVTRVTPAAPIGPVSPENESAQLAYEQTKHLRDAALADERAAIVRARADETIARINAEVRLAEIESNAKVAIHQADVIGKDRDGEREAGIRNGKSAIWLLLILGVIGGTMVWLFLRYGRGDLLERIISAVLPASATAIGGYQWGKRSEAEKQRAGRSVE